MPVIEGAQLIDCDLPPYLGDDGDLPVTGVAIVSLQRWRRDAVELRVRGDVGVRLQADASIEDLLDSLTGLVLIELDFPKFTDGRAYSTARMLREGAGFLGELRAVGDVLPDQLGYMRRCGIDSFVLAPGKSPAAALAASDHQTHHYQAAADDTPPRWRR